MTDQAEDRKDGIVFLFPGQGSQHIGMGKDFYERSEAVRNLFDRASETLATDFKKLCFEGPESVLLQTENAQPAVTLVNAACLEVLRAEGISPAAAAGHSLGEYAALLAADALDFADLLRLVRQRSVFMKEAAEKNPGGMTALVGLGADALRRICESAGGNGRVEIANFNSPKQAVISGEKKALEKASALAREEGKAFIIPLKVSGPWHSACMREAGMRLEEEIKQYSFRKPAIPVISNATAEYALTPEQIKINLVNQVSSPVLWQQSITRLIGDGCSMFVEVGPGKVLRGLMKEISKDVQAFHVENPASLEKFLLAKNAEAHA